MNSYRAPFNGETEDLFRLSDSITDCHHSTPLYIDEGRLVIRNYNIKNGRMLLDNLSFTDDENFNQRISRAIPEKGDLIITREAPMGEVCIIPQGVKCCLGQRMVLIKPNSKKVDNQFLLYAILSEYVQVQINKSNGTGSIVSNLRIPVLKELKIPYFEIEEQTKIGRVLSDIDAKIDLNNKINSELEAMAKMIYDYWFVQFDFPDENGKPYKSSGGKMVYNEELKREIPEGWEVKTFEYFEMYQPKTISEKEMDPTGKYFVFGANGIVGKYSQYNHEESEIAVTCRGNSCGNIVRTIPNSWVTGNAMIIKDSEGCLKSEFIYQLLNWVGLDTVISGSGQPQITRTNLSTLKFVKPNEEVLIEFNRISESIVKRKISGIYEDYQLADLRDWLLPMLMNGQVKVK
jgi:type I restriction enzyme, S subunit